MTMTLDQPSHRRSVWRGAVWRGAVWRGAPEDPRWSRPALWIVLAVAFVLYTWALSGNANEYYSAAILSGTKSWKAFFFGALDSGSFITVDKPPLALWVMGLSARVFGFSTWSMLIPQALAGVASVGLVYSSVRRAFPVLRPATAHSEVGQAHVAALIAAVVMTLTPITVAINRDNNPDTILVFLLVLAAWFCLESLRTGRLRSLLVCALFVGLAFNVKMLQAYVVVPAFVLAYLLCARVSWGKRVGHLLAAGAVMVVSSAWWMVIVDLLPADSRPYIGGSTDNSVWDLVIGYNGLGRIFGQGGGGPGGGGGGFGGGGGASFGGAAGADRLFNETMAGQISWLLPFCGLALVFALTARWRRAKLTAPQGADTATSAAAKPEATTPWVGLVTPEGGTAAGAGSKVGTAPEVTAPPIAVGASGAVGTSGTAGQPGASLAAWLVWGGWLVVHFMVFSFASGTFHPYYTTAMAPAVAAVTAFGGLAMWGAYRRSSQVWAWALPLGVAVTGAWSFVVLRRTPDFVPWLAWAVLAATVVAVAGLVLAKFRKEIAVKAAAVALVATAIAGLAGPAAFAVSPLGSQVNGSNPTAGPSSGGMGFGPGGGGFRGQMRPGEMPQGQFPQGQMPQGQMPQGQDGQGQFPQGQVPQGDGQGQDGQGQDGQGTERRFGRMGGGGPGGGISSSMVSYLVANQGKAEWLVAVSSAMQASSTILSTGKPVLAMGGFTGSDPAMTVTKLKDLVSSGKLRYVMAGGDDRGGPGRGNSEVTTWVQANCKSVTGQDGLYDCSS
ncbi:glycosyltransferase family 39 protein [Nonomuraea guangzhouensis]|uniref:Glycosyltransferase family 39 protein n=1 Tax=Nonomuraea guangzhouensis TaxID=1291555 RepID=A0ABW4H0G7_9ACTN|nr:glycosyltransferase family 39 protein [Nonomuraea guangzhouensis]